MPIAGKFFLEAVVTGIPILGTVTTTTALSFNSDVVGAASGGKVSKSLSKINQYAGLLGIDPVSLVLQGGPFVTGPVAITGVTTPKVQIVGGPRDGQKRAVLSLEPTLNEGITPTVNSVTVQHTVTVRGTNALISASQAGNVTFVSPVCIDAGGDNPNLPGVVKAKFVFVTTIPSSRRTPVLVVLF